MANTGKNIGIGCIVIVAAIILGLMCLGSMAKEPTEVDVMVEAPLEVQQGERFTVVARVRDLSGERRELVDLDVADSYLAGIVIESSDPPFSDAMHVPVDNSLSYSFDLGIEGGGEVVVTFYAYAAHAGDHQGDIDFCIDGAISCLSYPVRTIVR